MKTPLKEAIKEAGRYAVFMAVSVFVSTLLEKLTKIQSQDIYIVVLTLILRMIDKFLHEARKEKSIYTISKPSGILPF